MRRLVKAKEEGVYITENVPHNCAR